MDKTNHCATLCDLPDQVLLEILSYLPAENLLQWTNLTASEKAKFPLGSRLFEICGDKTLWRNVHWTGGTVKSSVLRKIVRFLGPYTISIHLQGGDGGKNRRKLLQVPESLLHSVQTRCTCLLELELENCTLDYHEGPFRNFPRSLEKIVLKNVTWTNLPFIKTLQSSPFFRLKKRLPSLQEVRFNIKKQS
jgi:hypothetical protein